jgi:predicted metal-binding protein
MRAGVVLSKPCRDACVVKPMFAGQFSYLFSDIDLLHADTALSAAFGSEHIYGNFFPR